MTYTYQVAILGPKATRFKPRLRRTIERRVRDLGVNLVRYLEFLSPAAVQSRNIKSPIVGVYFGASAGPSRDLDAVRELQKTATPIITVVEDLAFATASVPTELHGINALELNPDDTALDELTNLVLENLGLLRRSRRLFISYKRSDSAAIAVQLRQELDARGYDVFLGTHSVPKGDDFQEVLWQRITDSDVILLLDSPSFRTSKWTMDELAQAEAMTVGLLQIIWPGHTPTPHTDLCERWYLTTGDFDSTTLVTAVVKRIATAVEQLRARSLAARHDNLVREFCDAAATLRIKTIVQPERYILTEFSNGKTLAAVPAVGVVDALVFHEASRRFAARGQGVNEVLLVYDHRGLRPNWNAFLDWLDEFLPVKAVKVTTVASKLASR